MTAKFKLKPIANAVISVLLATSASYAYAAEQQVNVSNVEEAEKAVEVDIKTDKNKKAEQDAVEVIEVTGYRGSVQRSINAKRLADGIQDSIFAEDIGKSTDQNIGDAMSRITGVTVQESDGEGTRISVRGAGAALNTISLNGVALTSSLNGAGSSGSVSDESVDLSNFSSDILSSISVIKTPSADHDEGSLGANVILRTIRPLLIDKDKRTLEVQGRYDDYAKKNNFKLAGTFSEKFLDDTFGIIVTGAKETRDSRKDSLGASWLSPYQVVDIREGGATSVQTGQPTTTAQKALIADGRSFSTDVNTRDRETITAGFQILPTDVTDIQLDLSYSKATYEFDTHRIGTSKPNLSDGQRPNLDGDPQADWWTVDEKSHTLVKTLNRYGSGSLARNIGGNETTNSVATLKINHELTDNLIVEFTGGYSKTDFESLPNASVSTNNWNTIPLTVLENVSSEDIVPVGWDCSTGKCDLVTGDSPFVYVPLGHENGTNNVSNTGFNPYDPYSHHLGYLAKYDESSEDVNKSAFLDFDYIVDVMGVTSLEFGAKWSSRTKDVSTDYQGFQNNPAAIDEEGNQVAGKGAADIKLVDVLAGHGIPVDDFMSGLIPGNSAYNTNYLNGWGILDPNKAFAEMFNIPNAALDHNREGDRKITQENISLYTKVNFEYFDSRLTGNIGVRYVKTDNESFGNSTMTFQNNWNVFDPTDLIYNKQLANRDLEQCAPSGYNPDKKGQPNPTGDIYPCFEPRFSNGLVVNYDENGNVIDPVGQYADNSTSNRGWWANWQHRDMSTMTINETNRAFVEEMIAAGIISSETEMFRRSFAGTGDTSSEVFLPSININYQLTDEIITRFATSKTMARPRFDSLRPGFNASESLWTPGASKVTTYNPELKPLESINLDLSFEWYFNKSGLISLAYFRKDMKNFEERVKGGVYLKDIRTDYALASVDFNDFLIKKGVEQDIVNPNEGPSEGDITRVNEVTPLNSECLPTRIVQDQIRSAMPISCREFTADLLRNGGGAVNQGMEFSYNQSYDFLPGIWSGLGTNFNYTYTDSKSESEFEEALGLSVAAMPQAYTPKHSANTTLFWEKDGHQLRLTHRYNSDQLVSRGLVDGASWQDATNRLDFSANYQFNKEISFSFHALNLTNETVRTYFTSTSMDLGERDSEGNIIPFNEGNALDGDADTSRTISAYKTGRQFRLSARMNF